jgi:6-phospho-3-hexuloisomerase
VSRLLDEAMPLLAEIEAVVGRMDAGALDSLEQALLEARRIVVYGQGRTGLVMQALTMRLYHLGLDAHVFGGMTTPPVGPSDLFLVNASLGDMPTALALIDSAGRAGARVAVVTAVPDSPAGRAADVLLHLPAQTMADDLAASPRSRMPMGSQYELALFVLGEILVLRLAEARNLDFAAMRARHANLL